MDTEQHPDHLRTPELATEPDPRQLGFGVWSSSGIDRKTIKHQYEAVGRIELHEGVPEDIRVQFETARNLYLYAWFVYRFYPVVELQAYACMELALRDRFEEEMLAKGMKKLTFGPGLKRLLEYAIKNGYLKNEHFAVWRRVTEIRARDRTRREVILEMKRTGQESISYDDNIEITDEDRKHDYLGTLLETAPFLRNYGAHGSTSLDSQSLRAVQQVADVINQIFPKSET